MQGLGFYGLRNGKEEGNYFLRFRYTGPTGKSNGQEHGKRHGNWIGIGVHTAHTTNTA